jgi:D-glycero-D-manno-heptose 1,7-bisphosphate phosphatase
MHEVNDRLSEMAAAAGARIDAIYSCPHEPEAQCACRKPGIQLVLEAALRFGFDPASSIVIGDKSTDIELGRRLSAVTMLVSADGRTTDGEWVQPDYVIRDLAEAARIITELTSPQSVCS